MIIKAGRIKVVTLLLIILILITSSFIYISEKVDNNIRVDTNILNTLENIRNREGGYSDIGVLKSMKPDIYTTYYVLEIKKMLEGKIEESAYKEINEYFSYNKNELFNDNNFDNLSNIYFISTILAHGGNTKDDYSNEIVKYVLKLQTRDGSFAFSNKHKSHIENKQYSKYGETFLSTYFAVSTLSIFNAKPENVDGVHKWIAYMLNNHEYINDSAPINADYLFLLIEIARKTNFELTEFEPKINKLITTFNNKFKKGIADNEVSILEIDTIISLNAIYPLIELGADELKEIQNLITENQNSNGLYSLQDDQPNILPTYYAVRFATLYKFQINNKQRLIKELNRYKVKGGYRAIIDIPFTISDTYYAYKIEQIYDVQNIKFYSEFIDKVSKDKLMLIDTKELYYYLLMRKELGLDNSAFNPKDDLINNLRKSVVEKNIITENLLYELKSLRLLDQVIDDNTKTRIYKLIEQGDNKESLSKPLIQTIMDVNILYELNLHKNQITSNKLDQINTYLSNLRLKTEHTELDTLNLYYLLEMYNENGIPANGEVDILAKNIISQNELPDGFFTIGEKESNASYKFTYNYLYYLQN